MSIFDLSGRVAVITGGNGGIGLGMAEGLAQAGAKVVIDGNAPDAAKQIVAATDGGAWAVIDLVGDEADQADPGAFGDERARRGHADAALAAGDDGSLALQTR